jgi:F0F1-type ATP synthase membrane subunit a
LLTLTQAANNIVVGIGNVLGAAAITIKEKGFGGWLKEIALKGLDTAATVVNAVAKVFNAEASKGLAGVIAGALAAALIVGTVLMVANTVKTE